MCFYPTCNADDCVKAIRKHAEEHTIEKVAKLLGSEVEKIPTVIPPYTTPHTPPLQKTNCPHIIMYSDPVHATTCQTNALVFQADCVHSSVTPKQGARISLQLMVSKEETRARGKPSLLERLRHGVEKLPIQEHIQLAK